MTGLAAFDVDGTLTPVHTCTRFLVKRRGRWRYGLAAIRAFIKHRGTLRDEMKLTVLELLLGGDDAKTFREHGLRFSRWLETRLAPRSMERLRWHQQQGHQVVIISAGLGIYLRPLGERLGVDEVMAVEMVEVDGVLTGAVVGDANMTGPVKAQALRRYLADRGLSRSDVEIWAYGDSKVDQQFLEMADHPHVTEVR